jgi:hypothetical protein
LARIAVLLAVASIVLFVAGFVFLPWGDYLGTAAAIAALVHGGRALHQPRQSGGGLMALIGVGSPS